ncbi:TonB family protein [Phyllobacterium sp. LjRoot231]|uniref:energy transducer TonB family protein n=1 Tax=Phyllobacterium sp. LjRoot231 TaxID=3342289 RepID=UPI003ED0E16D
MLRPDWREVGLWSVAGFVVIGIHAGAAWYVQNYQPDAPASDIAAAVMIDMEPLPAPVVSEPVQEEPPVEAEPIKPDTVEQESAAPEPVPEARPEPEQTAEPVKELTPEQPEPEIAEEVPPEPEVTEPLDEQIEEVVALPKVEVPLPVARPTPKKPDVPKKQVAEKVVRKPAKKVSTATVEDEMLREAKQQPSVSRAASARQSETWRSRVQAYLARRASRARAEGQGTVRIRFVVTNGGDIVASSVVSSSGIPQLDQSVLETIRRASPVPSAPAGVDVSRQSFTVPFQIR